MPRYSLTELKVTDDDKITVRVWKHSKETGSFGHVSLELHGKYEAYVSAFPAVTPPCYGLKAVKGELRAKGEEDSSNEDVYAKVHK